MTTKRNWETIKEYEDILFDYYNGIARITINRERYRNAFTPTTTAEMSDALRICREETNHRFGLNPLFSHHFLQHRLRIRIQLGAFLTHNLIRQNGREFTRQFPTTEKRRPVNPLHQFR